MTITAINDPNTIICEHPLCHQNLTIIRDKNSSSELFRNAVRRLTYLLLYTATQDLETEEVTTVTPMAECKTQVLKKDVKIILAPINFLGYCKRSSPDGKHSPHRYVS